MKYIRVEWPDIQEYMDKPYYPEDVYFDPKKNVWFVPEEYEIPYEEEIGGIW